MGRGKGRMGYKVAQGKLGNDMFSPDSGDGFTDVYIYIKTYQLFTLNICSLLYVTYTSMKLQGKAGHQLAST